VDALRTAKGHFETERAGQRREDHALEAPARVREREVRPNDETVSASTPDFGPEHREALRAVVDYLWETEREDHEANPDPNHIFRRLTLLRELCDRKHERETKNQTPAELETGALSRATDTRRERNMSKRNLEQLEKLLAGKDHRRIENPPYMPLVVERLEGQPIISLCHYGEQNGDPMRDPEICFLVADGTAKPVYFRNDFVAVEHATIAGSFGDVPVKPQRQKDLNHFASMWFGNLRDQGFFERAQELSEQQAAEAKVPSGQNEASNTRERGETVAEQQHEKHETEKQQNGRESIATMELGNLRGEVYRRGEYYSVAVRRPFVGKDGNERLAFDTREQDIRDHVAMLQESEKIIHQDRLERAQENGPAPENRIRITRA
jgi:hypothetical protein